MVAAAVIGSAVVGGIATTVGASRAGDAVAEGSANAAQATIQSTEMQIAEISRQFDYQQQLLAPFVANQYAGQSAYMDLLGVGGGAQGVSPDQGAGAQPGVRARQGAGGGYAPGDPRGGGKYGDVMMGGQLVPGGRRDPRGGGAGPNGQPPLVGEGSGLNAPPYPGSGSTQFNRGDRGQFVDPNLDPTRLADTTRLGNQVRDTLQAGDTLAGDEFRQDVAGRSLAGGAAGTSVYGDTFQASPGYDFQVEEMNRSLDRRNSAGGNYGGRAIMEAQRRAQGLAAGDYYNWAQGRSRDVDRLATAESRDASRLDTAGINYLNRRAGDASRLDSAAAQEDRLAAGDQARGDQSYYNYLNQLGRLGGVGGNAAAQAVNSSQAAAGGVANAYGAQGSQLAANYGQLGVDQANIYGSQYASYNDIMQGGITNSIESGLIKI